MGTRARFLCTSVTHFCHLPDGININVEMGVDASSPDHDFTKYTPSGSLSMQVTNPALAVFFVPGKAYFLDFTPAD